jgi:hypothetical protein
LSYGPNLLLPENQEVEQKGRQRTPRQMLNDWKFREWKHVTEILLWQRTPRQMLNDWKFREWKHVTEILLWQGKGPQERLRSLFVCLLTTTTQCVKIWTKELLVSKFKKNVSLPCHHFARIKGYLGLILVVL